MSTTPDGQLAKALVNLETLLSNSATFQTAVGAASASAATAAIYWMGEEPDVVTAHAWIRLLPGTTADAPWSGGGGYYHKFPFEFVLFRPDAEDTEIADTDTVTQRNAKHKERLVAFLTWAGKVLREMQTLAKTGTYLQVDQFIVNGHMLSDPKDPDRYQVLVVGVQAS